MHGASFSLAISANKLLRIRSRCEKRQSTELNHRCRSSGAELPPPLWGGLGRGSTRAVPMPPPPLPNPPPQGGRERKNRAGLARFEFQTAKTTVMASAIEAIHRRAVRSYLAKTGYPAGRSLSVQSRTPVEYRITAFAGDGSFGFDFQTAPFVRHRPSISPRIAVVGFGRCWQTGIGRHGWGACACHATRIPIRHS